MSFGSAIAGAAARQAAWLVLCLLIIAAGLGAGAAILLHAWGVL